MAAAFLGWKNVFHCEINPFGRKVLEYWFPESISYDDITKTDFRKWRGHIDVLTGGFPCQPFSYAGKRGGQQDQRYLWPEMLRVINEVRPTWVIGENVAGIGTMVEQCRITDLGSEGTLFEKGGGLHRYTAEYTFTIERICYDLESKGYSVQPMLIPACAVGAPHRRDRIFFIAYYTDSCNDLRASGQHESESGKERFSERNEVRKPGEPSDVRSEMQSSFTDSDLQRCKESKPTQEPRRKERFACEENIKGGIRSLHPNERWSSFPTVSAVYRGNDGIPFDVDNLAIPFGKWRTESIKAYGNAIVPQVMFRIFQAIESVQNENRTY